MTALRSRLDRIERRVGGSGPLIAVLNYGESPEDAAIRVCQERGDRYADVLVIDTGIHCRWPDPNIEEMV